MGPGTTAAQRARIWNYEPMDLERTPFVWAAAAVLVDQPAKIPADSAGMGNGAALALAAPPPGPGASAAAGATHSPKAAAAALVSGSRTIPAADSAAASPPVSYTHLTLPTSDLV